jgi:hypothetical protein
VDMEYERKFRWANYGSGKCKTYLRNDFSYECAYCKLEEQACGVIGSEYFEIDHFEPQADSDDNPGVHLYSNLFYSCRKCNHEKSDFWSRDLLNPCDTDIFKNDKHIKGGYDHNNHYKYDNVTLEGKTYIDTFKLNSRYHIRIRQRRKQHENNIKVTNELINEILHKFSSKKSIGVKDELIKQLDALRKDNDIRISDLLRDEYFEAVEKYLSSREIKNSIVFEAYNMDFKIKYNDRTSYCELIVDNSDKDTDEKIKYIDKDKLSIWFESLKCNIGILYFYPKLNKLYLFSVTDNVLVEELDGLNSRYCVKLNSANLI